MTDGLRNCGVPLGGLGTGSVEIRRDGYLHEWQIMNNRPWGSGPVADIPLDAFFFALNVRGEAWQRSAILGIPPPYVGHDFRFLNDPYSMPWVTHPESIDAEVTFPFTRLDYHFADMPIKVELEAFSPFIPLDEKNSGLPVASFTYSLTNTSTEPLEVSLLGALRNIVGYASPDSLSEMVADGPAIHFSRDMDAGASDFGSMVLGCPGAEAEECSFVLHPRNPRDIWEPIRSGGRLENIDLGEFGGKLGNIGAERLARLRQGLPYGVLCRTLHLEAGASTTVTFILAWHFPNFIEENYPEKQVIGGTIGHMYSNWFAGAREVFDYAVSTFDALRNETRVWSDCYFDSSLPRWLLDAVSAQLTTLVKASWWDAAGRFGVWEGLGCCGLQTTDVIYYGSAAIVQLFPEIEKSQLRLTREHIADGAVPHNMPGNFSCCDIDPCKRIDLIPEFILLLWRDVLWTGDIDYIREMWPTILEALDRLWSYDTDGDGLPNSRGPDQTYDQFPLKGTSAFVGFIFAASLRAAAELAALMGDTALADDLVKRRVRALAALNEQLWTGEYYRLSFDPAEGKPNDGVMLDQVNGDWFTRLATGQGMLPEDKVTSALHSVLNYCSAPEGYLSNCVWPSGEPTLIGRHTADQANWPWSGVEYASASHMVAVGLREEGLRVARAVWDRYERAGLRFNHVECGGHYCRALSAWALYQALCGFCYNALDESLSLIVGAEEVRCAITLPTGWGTLHFGDGKLTLRVTRGNLSLRTIVLMMPNNAELIVSSGSVDDVVEREAGATCVKFAKRVSFAAGDSITLHILPEDQRRAL